LFRLRSKGRILELTHPIVMGILNATPDSFYNKGQGSDMDGLLALAEKMLREGAVILDIGGVSTKPGKELIDTDDELARVIPVIAAIHKRFPEVWLSVDTYNARVAIEAVAAGAAIVNDVSAGSIDMGMIAAVAALKVPYIAMHMQGTPQTMQADPQYEDVVEEVRHYLANIVEQCDESGIGDIIIDPGFGFGKTVEHNFSLLRSLRTFSAIGRPVLAGLSRKSMICKPLRVNPEHALNGTTALNMVALQQGAHILRVHDVKEAMQTIILFKCLQETGYR
jgi:dihydropteroate synthase